MSEVLTGSDGASGGHLLEVGHPVGVGKIHLGQTLCSYELVALELEGFVQALDIESRGFYDDLTDKREVTLGTYFKR